LEILLGAGDMDKYNFKSHAEVPSSLANYVVDVCVYSGFEINKLTDIELSDINGFLNGLEEQCNEVDK
tara:strand:+ start:678 stop:881 length:204 start_codon:yes stop_codon:yes gene_type:complete